MCNKRRKFDQKGDETKLASHFFRELHVKKRREEGRGRRREEKRKKKKRRAKVWNYVWMAMNLYGLL